MSRVDRSIDRRWISVAGRGWKEVRKEERLLTGMRFLWGNGDENIVVTVAQLCEHIKNHQIVHFKYNLKAGQKYKEKHICSHSGRFQHASLSDW